jgi:hypothetical protein
VIKALLAFIWGGFVGLAGTVFHNAFVPFGFLFAMASIAVGIWAVGRMTYSRRYKLIAVAGLLAIVLKGAISGTGNEILILSNTTGTLFLIFGTLIAVLMALRSAD